MAKKINVLLLEDVAGLGKTGDIVTVAEGFARNQLFPNAQAALADSNTKEQANDQLRAQQKQQDDQLNKLQEVADRLDGTELLLEAKVKEGDEIFGSISSKQIADELDSQAKLKLKGSDVVIETPIKKLGSHSVVIRLSPQVEFNITVTVNPSADSLLTDDEE